MLRRLYPYWRPAWRDTVAGAALLVLAAGLELIQPWPIKWLVDSVFGSQPAPGWLRLAWPPLAVLDRGGGIAGVCLAIVLLATGHRIVGMFSQRLLIRAGARLVLHLRCHVCDHLHRLSIGYHDRSRVGDLLYRVAYDTHAAQSLLSGAVVPAATGILILVGIMTVMLWMDALLTLVALAAAPLFWLTIRFFGPSLEERSKRYHERESSFVSAVQESLSAIRAVQAFTRESEVGAHFRAEAGESVAASERLVRRQLAFACCVGLVMAFGTAAVVWVGAHRVLAGRLWPGDILVYLAYLGMLYQPMSAFSQSANVVQSARVQLGRLFEVLDAVPEIADRPEAIRLWTVEGRVEFREVSFEYEPGRPVLRNINLTVEPGQVVALVGRTGAGKTTMASLLLRFYDPTAGAVLLDGHDLRDLQLAWLRRRVSVVPQEAVLFSATIRDNIAYGRPGATAAEIEEAARLAQADDFIRALPHGYETQLGERGVNLSGGERQRLVIARAFLKNAPVLVLDEPTSALDAQTEDALLTSLKRLTRRRTTFIIAHRLSTVRHADMILVLENGAIVERGSHRELLSADTAYRLLHRIQGEPSGELGPAGAPAR